MSIHSPARPVRPVDPKIMSFVEHLDELRARLVKCVLAIAAGSVAGWFLAPHTIAMIDAPIKKVLGQVGGKLVVDTIYGGFTLDLKIALIIGFAIALPVTIWQLWGFVSPAFGEGANRWGPLWMTAAFVLFAAGAVTGWFVIPLAVTFFSKFQNQNTEILVFASQYVSFIVLILAVFGISFELPLVLVSLAAVGITNSRWLSSKRLIFFFGIFIFATVVTPGADLFSPLILGGILYVLYELSILVVRIMGK